MDVAVAHRAATEIVRGTSDAKMFVRKLCFPSVPIVMTTAAERPQNVQSQPPDTLDDLGRTYLRSVTLGHVSG